MAEFIREIEIEIKPNLVIDDRTAHICLSIIEAYVNQHKEIDLVGKREDDGSLSFSFENRAFVELKQ